MPRWLCATRIAPQRALADGETDRRAGAAIAVIARAHAEALRRGLVEAAVGVETGVVDRLGHRGGRLAQALAQAPGTIGRGIGLGRQAGFGLEQTMEVERTHAQSGGQRLQCRRRLRRLDHPAGLRHPLGALLRRQAAVAGGAPAGPIAGGLGGLGSGEELDVLAPGPTRRGTRAAIDPGGLHRIDERPVRRRVARQHGGPALFVGVVGVARIELLAHGVSPVGADDARRLIRHSSARTPVLALEFEQGHVPGFGRCGRPSACLPIATRHNGPLEPAEGLGTWRSNG